MERPEVINPKKKKVKLSYETFWKFIIRPPRDVYPESLLGHPFFAYKGKNYMRRDFELISTQGYKMKCSFVEPDPAERPCKEMPVIIYLHGNSSSRLEGLRTLEELLKRDINLFVVDMPGCGLSEGEYISLGYYESNDVGIIIDFLEDFPGVGNIGLWGRSMGAATALLYAHRDERVKAICMDSPFASFCRLAKELTSKYITVPGFLVDTVLSFVRGTIIEKNGLDIYKLNPIDVAPITFQPAMFVHAMNDKLISIQHSIDISSIYGGERTLKCSDVGGHNSKRPDIIIKNIGEFFTKYLQDNNDEIISYEENSDFDENSPNKISENNIQNKEESQNTNEESKIVNSSQEEYMNKKEEEDLEHFEKMKEMLSNINNGDIEDEKDKNNVNINKDSEKEK